MSQLIHAYYLYWTGCVGCTSFAKRMGGYWNLSDNFQRFLSSYMQLKFQPISQQSVNYADLRSQFQLSVKKRVISKLAIKILTYSHLPEVHRTRHRFLTVQAAVTPTRVLPAPVCEETTGTLCSSTSQTVLYNLQYDSKLHFSRRK